MHNTPNQKKVIELFRTFFEKIVLPSVKNQPTVMQEWKYLISIISEDPIQSSKLDLYMTMLNHQKTNKLPIQPSVQKRQVHEDSENHFNRLQRPHNNYSHNHYAHQQMSSEREVKESKEEMKKKMLGALEAFHNSLLQNQQKLQGDFKGGRTIKQPQQRRYM